MNFKILMKSFGIAFLTTIACIGICIGMLAIIIGLSKVGMLAIIIGLSKVYWHLLLNYFTLTDIGSFILVLFIGLTAFFYKDLSADNNKNNEK